MRSKPELVKPVQESALTPEDTVAHERICSDLQRRGVTAPAAEVLARRVADEDRLPAGLRLLFVGV